MGKHLTLDQRIAIQIGLERNQPIKAIARGIGKSPRTVAREIKQRRRSCDEPRYGRVNNRCEHRGLCPDRARCPGPTGVARRHRLARRDIVKLVEIAIIRAQLVSRIADREKSLVEAARKAEAAARAKRIKLRHAIPEGFPRLLPRPHRRRNAARPCSAP